MKRIFIFLIFTLVQFVSFSQRNSKPDNLINEIAMLEQTEKEYNYFEYKEKLRHFSLDEIYTSLQKHEKDESQAVRRKIYSMYYDLARETEDSLFKQKLIVKLTEGNYFVTGLANWSSKLKYFNKADFNIAAKKNIEVLITGRYSNEQIEYYTSLILNERSKSREQAYTDIYTQQNLKKRKIKKKLDSISSSEEDLIREQIRNAMPDKNIILLCGYLQMEDIEAELYRIISNKQIKDNLLKWNARLALARMGDPEQSKYLLNVAKKQQINDMLIYKLVPDLMYTRQKIIFDYLIELLNSNEKNCFSPNPESSKMILCGYRLMEYLAPVVEDFPLRVSASGDIKTDDYENALSITRTWFAEHLKSYKIKTDLF